MTNSKIGSGCAGGSADCVARPSPFCPVGRRPRSLLSALPATSLGGDLRWQWLGPGRSALQGSHPVAGSGNVAALGLAPNGQSLPECEGLAVGARLAQDAHHPRLGLDGRGEFSRQRRSAFAVFRTGSEKRRDESRRGSIENPPPNAGRPAREAWVSIHFGGPPAEAHGDRHECPRHIFVRAA